jgi:GDP-4-dehydro-6-deoxy-D-mannose reductase
MPTAGLAGNAMTSSPNRILVTGADGFVGGYLLPELRAAFPSAVIIACAQKSTLPSADIILPLDLDEPQSIRDCLAAAKADAVIHLAAESNVPRSFSEPERTWRINVDGTLLLARTLMQSAPETRLVYISSAEIYGLSFQAGIPLDENAAFAPGNPYAASKAVADLALGEMGLRGLKVLRLRPSNHTGPGQTDAFVVPAFALQLAKIAAGRQEAVMQVGALDRWRDFLDVRDVCAAYVAALRNGDACPNGAAFNIASGIPRRIGDILEALIARVGLAIEIRTDAARLRPTDVVTAVSNPSRARDLLGWTPLIAWDDTLDAVLADARAKAG